MSETSNIPQFAVVGHPNKGKSSIVATLSRDDSVRIEAESGTTREADAFTMTVDNRELYSLIDTPGFQRARRTLAWLEQWMTDHGKATADRAEAVKAFVEAHRNTSQFTDEVELLQPIIDGAGILYVVDGSTPMGEEYEAEMEILRWTGRPSMALINPISQTDYIDEWRATLGQYFKIVRVFNAVTAEFDKRIDLLRAFGELDEAWKQPMREAVQYLQDDRQDTLEEAASYIAEMLIEMLTYEEVLKLPPDHFKADIPKQEAKLKENYLNHLRRLEQRCRDRIESLYHFDRLERDEPLLDLVTDDLMSRSVWNMLGLSKSQLAFGGFAAGASGGLMLDAALGGMTLGSGTLTGGIGGAIAGLAGYLSADQLGKVKLGPLPAGGTQLTCGPVKNPNFAFVILNRARLHQFEINRRTHAMRNELRLKNLTDSQAKQAIQLKSETQKQLMKHLVEISKSQNADTRQQLHIQIHEVLNDRMP